VDLQATITTDLAPIFLKPSVGQEGLNSIYSSDGRDVVFLDVSELDMTIEKYT